MLNMHCFWAIKLKIKNYQNCVLERRRANFRSYDFNFYLKLKKERNKIVGVDLGRKINL